MSRLTDRQQQLHDAVVEMGTGIAEQVMLIPVLAGQHTCSEKDVAVVRDAILYGLEERQR